MIVTDTKLFVPVVTLPTQDNPKLLEQLKSGFKRTINWNKYHAKVAVQLDFLIDPSNTTYYLPLVEIKGYNVMTDGRNFFDQPVKNNSITYNIQKIATGQGDNYTTGGLLNYAYFKNYKIVAIDLNKEQVLNADPKAIQQVNPTANLDQDGNTTILFIIEEVKKSLQIFHKELLKYCECVL